MGGNDVPDDRLAGAQAASRAAMLEAALQSLDKGVLVLDADERVVFHNERALELLELPAELVSAGPSFLELLRHQQEHGEFDHIASDLSEIPVRLDRHAHAYRRERPNGMILEVRTRPLPDGFVIRTYTDVTELVRLQAQVDYAVLFDSLTGLPNRLSLREQLDARLQDRPRSTCLLYINLDRFQLLNDAARPRVRRRGAEAVAARLQEAACRPTSSAARAATSSASCTPPTTTRRSSARVAARAARAL